MFIKSGEIVFSFMDLKKWYERVYALLDILFSGLTVENNNKQKSIALIVIHL